MRRIELKFLSNGVNNGVNGVNEIQCVKIPDYNSCLY